FPKFNFVGKLLGPRGNSLKRFQEETLTKMSILGKGSMRDKAKEEELRKSGEVKYFHLSDDLHCLPPTPAEAYARMGHALEEIKKFLIPDYNDEIRCTSCYLAYKRGTNPSNNQGKRSSHSPASGSPGTARDTDFQGSPFHPRASESGKRTSHSQSKRSPPQLGTDLHHRPQHKRPMEIMTMKMDMALPMMNRVMIPMITAIAPQPKVWFAQGEDVLMEMFYLKLDVEAFRLVRSQEEELSKTKKMKDQLVHNW
ncbi:hypothetical protein E2I00_000454, partial [Balaenoptera physalus]